MTLLLVMLGAALGAPCRWLLDQRMQAVRWPTVFPWGTWTVNVVGSFLLGLLLGSPGAGNPHVVAVVGTGFCGGFTTFSTFGSEAVRLLEDGWSRQAAQYVVASVAVALLAVSAGYAMSAAVWS